jgi:triosephosphate isomerase
MKSTGPSKNYSRSKGVNIVTGGSVKKARSNDLAGVVKIKKVKPGKIDGVVLSRPVIKATPDQKVFNRYMTK